MKQLFRWSRWSITTKILVTFLGLSVISMLITGYIALSYIKGIGNYALETSTSLGESAIQDSTTHLVNLGEETITQIAKHVARQIELYLETRPVSSIEEMRKDVRLREIAVQPVGTTGYTTILDPYNYLIVIHKFPEQEKNLIPLKELLPSFWALLNSSASNNPVAGYYDWLEVDGTIKKKYASIAPIKLNDGRILSLWATTYIDEFSRPVEETKKEISESILNSTEHINRTVNEMRDVFLIIMTVLINVVIGLALFLSRVITNPIVALKRGAEAIGIGNLDYRVKINASDELGELANTFNKMAQALKNNMEELKRTAVENIAKERRIQDNLRLYAQKISEAQEAERKRIARELHDETAQSLIVVSRHLDDLASGNSKLTPEDIRLEVKKILEGVRHFSQELRPSILDDLGLIPAIKWLASDMTRNHNIPVETEIRGDQRPLSPDYELTLFRIIQEALANVRKHSQATRAMVRIEFNSNHIKITVQDNGKGFDMPARMGDFTRNGKLGLVGIQERVQLIGGNFKIDSQKGKGTTLIVEVPY